MRSAPRRLAPETMPSISAKRSPRSLTMLFAAVLAVAAVLAATAPAPPATAIIGGTAAQTGTFPSLAYVVDFQGQLAYQCTGTVIAPSLVLTAAHCAENMQTGVPFSSSGFRVVTGAVDPLQAGEPVSTVLGVIVYPGLRRRVDDGDVALLVLSTPTSVPPIALASPGQAKRLVAGTSATIVGWGKTAYEQTSLTEQLQSASTVVQARKWCRRDAPPFFARSEICTITPPSYATGVCQGDSGGPLIASGPEWRTDRDRCRRPRVWTLLDTSSLGVRECRLDLLLGANLDRGLQAPVRRRRRRRQPCPRDPRLSPHRPDCQHLSAARASRQGRRARRGLPSTRMGRRASQCGSHSPQACRIPA